MQETWRNNACTCKTTFYRLHFPFILISFKNIFQKFELPNSRCGLSASAAYTPVFTVFHIYTSLHYTPQGRYELNKLTFLPMCSFIAQLVEHGTSIVEVTGSKPVEVLVFFRLLLSNCLNWTIYCDNHSPLWSTTAVQIYELYTSHLFTPTSRSSNIWIIS